MGKILAKRFGWEFISTGMMFRSIGQVSNLDALQTNLAAETNTSIDAKVDNFIVERAALDIPFVMDSRMAWHFVPQSLKVYLLASVETAANRVLLDPTRETEVYSNRQEAVLKLEQRRRSEVDRYRRLYGVDIDDMENYDLVIVTDGALPEEIADLIVARLEGEIGQKFWIKSRQLVPMMTIRELSHISERDVPTGMRPEPLPLVLFKGFGFAFEHPILLAAWLRSGSNFIAFADRRPSYLRDGEDLVKLAMMYGIGHYYDWEEISNVDLNIKPILGGSDASN